METIIICIIVWLIVGYITFRLMVKETTKNVKLAHKRALVLLSLQPVKFLTVLLGPISFILHLLDRLVLKK